MLEEKELKTKSQEELIGIIKDLQEELGDTELELDDAKEELSLEGAKRHEKVPQTVLGELKKEICDKLMHLNIEVLQEIETKYCEGILASELNVDYHA